MSKIFDELDVKLCAFVEGGYVAGYQESNGQGEPAKITELKVFVYSTFGDIQTAYLNNKLKGAKDLVVVNVAAALTPIEREEIELAMIDTKN